ncbi:MAG: NAD(P)H-dependent oxidoreductase [Nonomuraea sp.]|nr:NAD(P)H-dependent oxidoreductase [Nonomuraea sp.]
METERLRVAVIVGSTREGRVGDVLAGWFADQAGLRDDLDVRVIDLGGYDFPARYPRRASAAMRRFTGELAASDAFVLVTPEYNRSFPASLKQAVDYGYDEWRAKPVGFVSYGSGSDGVFAVEQLRVVFTELHAVTMRDVVGVDLLGPGVDATGRPVGSDGQVLAAGRLLGELSWWGRALRGARAAVPYVC